MSISEPREVEKHDVIVVGGGPAGSAAATLVAQAGFDVLLLERNETPPFKVGESLIPATYETLERLGMLDDLRRSHFPKKYSVQFFSGSGRASSPFYFSETDPSERSQTWQVLRSEFDGMLLDNADDHGVIVRTGTAVKEVLFEGDRAVGVKARFANGETREIRSRVLMDATGQRAMLGRQLGIRRHDPCLRMAAFFTHFEGAHRDSGIDEGATLILQTRDNKSWFWYIPLPRHRVSVGVVGPIDYLIKEGNGNPQQTFDEQVKLCPGLIPRLEGAEQAMEMKVLNDFSYISERAAGDGWVLVGDAYGFLDPIYSSGVLLALKSAELAADATIEALRTGDLSAERLNAFEPLMREGMASFRQLVYAFYSPRFNFARFLRAFPQHRLAVVDILVGDVFDRKFSALFDDMQDFICACPSEENGMSRRRAAKQVAGSVEDFEDIEDARKALTEVEGLAELRRSAPGGLRLLT